MEKKVRENNIHVIIYYEHRWNANNDMKKSANFVLNVPRFAAYFRRVPIQRDKSTKPVNAPLHLTLEIEQK